MRPPQTVRRMRLLASIALLLVLTASSAGLSGADSGGSAAGWERKLDPFLRRIALGTVRVQGRFVDAVARRSAAAARSLPAFVQVERADAPIVQVKAGISAKVFAAGNGLETGNGVVAGTFAGVAPEADLLVVRVFDNNGNFCGACDLTAAVQFIARTAAATGKPWVGNMSLGTDLGAHDGTDPDEMSIDAAVGPGTRGAAMAIAAGNSGGRDGSPQPMHWEGPLPAAGASISNTFPLPYTPKSGADNDAVWIDFWYKGADSITVEIVSPTSIVVGAARGADSGIVSTADGAVHVDATRAHDPVNGDNEVFVQIWDSSACAPVVPPRNGTWTIRITTNVSASPAPSFDLWNEADAGSLAFVSLATSNLGKSVGIPGTSRHALTVGSYADQDR